MLAFNVRCFCRFRVGLIARMKQVYMVSYSIRVQVAGYGRLYATRDHESFQQTKDQALADFTLEPPQRRAVVRKLAHTEFDISFIQV
jgi:hypothetical protein